MMFNSALVYELACLKVYAEPLLFGIDKSEPEYQEAKRLLKFLDYLRVPIEDIRRIRSSGSLWGEAVLMCNSRGACFSSLGMDNIEVL